MNRVCTICARGGSKGVKGKNLIQISGKPLLAHSIEQAIKSGLFVAVAVSSDDPQILECAKEFGANQLVVRPQELASDTSPKVPAIRHCVETVEQRLGQIFDIVVDLDATSPLRNVADIQKVTEMIEDPGISNVITATNARRSPYFNMVQLKSSGAPHLVCPPKNQIVRRQDSPHCFDMNASIYAWKRGFLDDSDTLFHASTRLYLMPEERSLDIDSELDLKLVSFLLEEKNGIK